MAVVRICRRRGSNASKLAKRYQFSSLPRRFREGYAVFVSSYGRWEGVVKIFVLRKIRASRSRTLTSPIIPVHVSSTLPTHFGLSRLTMQEDHFKNSSQSEAETTFADYFHDPDTVADSSVAWQLESNGVLLDAVRLLFQGTSALARLRLWALFTLVGQGKAFMNREELDSLYYALRPEATDAVIKRFRDAALLSWDESPRQYGVTPLAQQVSGLLATLAQPVEDELTGLLSQVVGADQLGTLQGSQVHMLQAQLVRLHHEFSDAIASGSEFRLREARKRYDRAARLIDRASSAITAIISNARGERALEQAARALGQAQSRLLAMASQFNRALQQVDRQRVTLGTTGITSTDVKRWLQTQMQLDRLSEAALHSPVALAVLSPHEMLDVAEAEFERDRPEALRDEPLPVAQVAPVGDLTAVALPQELGALTSLLAQWALGYASEATDGNNISHHPVQAALLVDIDGLAARYAQVAYKAQLLPLLSDVQAQGLPGATGDLARQPWRVQWHTDLTALEHPAITQLSSGQLEHSSTTPTTP